MVPDPQKMGIEEKDESLGDTEHSSVTGPLSRSSERGDGHYEQPDKQDTTQRASRVSRRSRSSRRSRRSDRVSEDSDPLSQLGLALSHGSHGFDEIAHVRTATSAGSSRSRLPEFEVVFDEDDPGNPRCWPLWYRAWVVFAISFTTWVVVFYSTSYTSSIPGLVSEFDLTSPTVATLGMTTYLVGLAVGSLMVAPASELYGRRPIYVVCMICFTLLVIPSCVASSLEEIIVVRFFG